MQVTQQDIDGIRVATLSGRFDAHEAPALGNWIDASLADPRLVVNLEGVNFLDSTALATLVRGMKHCRERGGDLALAGMQPAVRVIFELTGLDRAFAIHATAGEAAASFAAP